MRFLILLLLLCSSFPRRPWVRTRLAAATARYRVRGRFNEKLLIKQEGEPLNIVDVLTSAVVTVSKTEFITPSAFIFLYEHQTFLTFRSRQVTVWNFKGEQVHSCRLTHHCCFACGCHRCCCRRRSCHR